MKHYFKELKIYNYLSYYINVGTIDFINDVDVMININKIESIIYCLSNNQHIITLDPFL